MKKIPISKDAEKIAALKANLLTCLPVIQEAYNEFQKADFFDESFTIPQMLNNFDEAKNRYHREVIRKELTPGSKLLVNEAEAMRLFPLEVSNSLTSAIANAKNVLSNYGIKPEYFILKEGKVLIDNKEVKTFIDQNSLFAETEKEIELYNLLQNFIKAMTEMNQFVEENPTGLLFSSKLRPIIIERWLEWGGGNDYRINEKVFRYMKKKIRNAGLL